VCKRNINKYLDDTGIFVCCPNLKNVNLCRIEIQKGILRTNCIDCLDRTNVYQELMGVITLGKQVKTLYFLFFIFASCINLELKLTQKLQ
jgi:hypothetical protein